MQWLKRIKNCLLGLVLRPDAQSSSGPSAPDAIPSHSLAKAAMSAQAEQLACRPASWDDVITVTSLLERHGVKYVLLGGYALYARGIIRQTGDVDILVENTPENNKKWIGALSELPDKAAAGLEGEDNPFLVSDDGDVDGGEPGVIRIADEFVVDVMPMACGLAYADLAGRIDTIDMDDGATFKVLDLKGLWLTKQTDRDKDKMDKFRLEAALRSLNEWPVDQD